MTERAPDESGVVGLIALKRINTDSPEPFTAKAPVDCSLVVVQFADRVLFGFNIERGLWELPGGSVDPSESSYDAALRELAEETGIHEHHATWVARAEFAPSPGTTTVVADVYAITLESAPTLVVSDELNAFRWWDSGEAIWQDMSALDAHIVREIRS